jgi:hypothetical protein
MAQAGAPILASLALWGSNWITNHARIITSRPDV